jgi:hypothetical protein
VRKNTDQMEFSEVLGLTEIGKKSKRKKNIKPICREQTGVHEFRKQVFFKFILSYTTFLIH